MTRVTVRCHRGGSRRELVSAQLVGHGRSGLGDVSTRYGNFRGDVVRVFNGGGALTKLVDSLDR